MVVPELIRLNQLLNMKEKIEKTIYYITQISVKVGYNIFVGFDYRIVTNNLVLVLQKGWLNVMKKEVIIINDYTLIDDIKKQLIELYGEELEDN